MVRKAARVNAGTGQHAVVQPPLLKPGQAALVRHCNDSHLAKILDVRPSVAYTTGDTVDCWTPKAAQHRKGIRVRIIEVVQIQIGLLLAQLPQDLKAKQDKAVKNKETAFYEGQLQSARYFINSILPITMGKMKAIEAADAATVEIPEASFGG